MPQLKHPISGALYSLEGNGLVKVDNNGVVGYFTVGRPISFRRDPTSRSPPGAMARGAEAARRRGHSASPWLIA